MPTSRHPQKRCPSSPGPARPHPLVAPGDPPRRHTPRPAAHPACPHHRLVMLATRPPSQCTTFASEATKATVVLGHGGTGNDTLTFSGTDLQLYGDAGNDRINAEVDSTDEQFLYGGTGNDTLRYTLGEKADAGATVDLYGGAGKDQLYAGRAHDGLHFLPDKTPARGRGGGAGGW